MSYSRCEHADIEYWICDECGSTMLVSLAGPDEIVHYNGCQDNGGDE
jgi:hypothetical protein